tara:strand:+ start:38 stop:583 length:546 start_codon:yes stop_codon:yes gene_type:complete
MEKNNNTIEFNINFGGFYESIHSHMIESVIANHFDHDDYYDVDDNDIDTVDINAMQLDYCEQWLEHYKEIIPFGVGFVGIDSPDYYNFETDKITVRIGTNRVNELIDTSKHDYDFIEWLDDASQSYDGFNSFYQGFEQVKINKAVFMMYYTDYITEQNKETIEYFWDSIWPDIALLETVKS